MSTINTSIAPSYAGGGGDGGKRGRGDDDDGRDRRRHDRPKPLDKISIADFGPEGKIRQLILLLLQVARLGDLPCEDLITTTFGPREKTLAWRTTIVSSWLDGLMTSPEWLVQAHFTELAETFVHVLRAVNTAGRYDQLVTIVVEFLTSRAIKRAEAAE